MMEHVKAIQCVVDEHKEQMPTGAVTTIMENLQKLYDDKTKLYRAQMTHICSVGYLSPDSESLTKMVQFTTTSIVESVDAYPTGVRNQIQLIKSGKCFNCWVEKKQLPMVFGGCNNFMNMEADEEMLILHSLEPLVPEEARKKRRA